MSVNPLFSGANDAGVRTMDNFQQLMYQKATTKNGTPIFPAKTKPTQNTTTKAPTTTNTTTKPTTSIQRSTSQDDDDDTTSISSGYDIFSAASSLIGYLNPFQEAQLSPEAQAWEQKTASLVSQAQDRGWVQNDNSIMYPDTVEGRTWAQQYENNLAQRNVFVNPATGQYREDHINRGFLGEHIVSKQNEHEINISTEKTITFPFYKAAEGFASWWGENITKGYDERIAPTINNYIAPMTNLIGRPVGVGLLTNFNPAIRENQNKGLRAVVDLPASLSPMVGMIPPGVERLVREGIRDPMMIPGAITAGLAMQAQGLAQGAQMDLMGTAVNLAGAALLFKGGTKALDVGVSSMRSPISSRMNELGILMRVDSATRPAVSATFDIARNIQGIKSTKQLDPDLSQVTNIGSQHAVPLTRFIAANEHSIIGGTVRLGQYPTEQLWKTTKDVDILVNQPKEFSPKALEVLGSKFGMEPGTPTIRTMEGRGSTALDVHPFPENYPIGKPGKEIAEYSDMRSPKINWLPNELLRGDKLTQEFLYTQVQRSADATLGKGTLTKWDFGPESHRLKDALGTVADAKFLASELETRLATTPNYKVLTRLIGRRKIAHLESSTNKLIDYYAQPENVAGYLDSEVFLTAFQKLQSGMPISGLRNILGVSTSQRINIITLPKGAKYPFDVDISPYSKGATGFASPNILPRGSSSSYPRSTSPNIGKLSPASSFPSSYPGSKSPSIGPSISKPYSPPSPNKYTPPSYSPAPSPHPGSPSIPPYDTPSPIISIIPTPRPIPSPNPVPTIITTRQSITRLDFNTRKMKQINPAQALRAFDWTIKNPVPTIDSVFGANIAAPSFNMNIKLPKVSM